MGTMLDRIREEARREREEEEKARQAAASKIESNLTQTQKRLQQAATGWKTSPATTSTGKTTTTKSAAGANNSAALFDDIQKNVVRNAMSGGMVRDTFRTMSNYLNTARNATEKDDTKSALTRTAIESRIQELEEERAKLNRTRAGITYQSSTPDVIRSYDQRISANKDELDGLKQQLKDLNRAGTASEREQYENELEDAKALQANLRGEAGRYYGGNGYGGSGNRDLVQVAEDSRDVYGRLTEADAAVAALERQLDKLDYVDSMQGKTYEDDFWGQTKANYRLGRLTQDVNDAFNEYLNNPTEANREYAFTLANLDRKFQEENKDVLDDEGAVLPIVSQSAASYVPQFIDQAKAWLAGVAGGGAAGALVGNPVGGARVGSSITKAAQSFGQMRGAAFRMALEAGVDEETARAASMDEGFVSALIEGGLNYVTWGLSGAGDLLGAAGNMALKNGSKNAAVKMIAGAFGKSATDKVAKQAAAQAGKSVGSKVAGVAGKSVLDAMGEYGEEFLQQGVSIANLEREGTGIWDLVKESAGTVSDALTGKNDEALAEMTQAGEEGFKIGLMFGGTTLAVNTTISSYLNAKTEKQRQQIADAVRQDEESLNALIEDGKASGEGSVSAKIANQIEQKKAAGKDVTRQDVEKLIVSNEVYIQEEAKQAASSEASQATRDVSKENVSQPAQREAALTAPLETKQEDPLLEAAREAVGAETPKQSVPYNAMSTSNPVRQRHVATAKSVQEITGYGEHGANVFTSIVEETGADPEKVKVEFQSAYEAGRTGLDVRLAKLNGPVQQEAFNAGKLDAIMDMKTAKAKAQGVTVRSDAGFDQANLPADVTKTQWQAVDALAKATGVRVQMTKGLKGNAEIRADGTVLIDENFEREVGGKKRSIVFYAAHEIGMHRLMELAPEEGQAFINAVVRDFNSGLAYGTETVTERRQAAYAAQDVQLTTGKAMEEVAADTVLSLYDDEAAFFEAIDRVINGKDEKAKKGAKKFKEILDDVVKKLRQVVAKLTGKEKAEARQVLNDVEQLRDLFEKGLKAATNRAKGLEFSQDREYNGSTETQYSARNVAREFQRKFTGRVTSDWIIDLSDKEKAAIGHALKTGYGRIDVDGNGGSVNALGYCYLFDVMRSGGVRVTDVVDSNEFNIHSSRIGGVYDEQGKDYHETGAAAESGGRGQRYGAERIAAAAKTRESGANDRVAGYAQDGNARGDLPIVQGDGEGVTYSLRTKPAPKKTVEVYKLMRLQDGKILPLFIDSTEELTPGLWYDADSPNLDFLKKMPSGIFLVDANSETYETFDEYLAKSGEKKKKYPSKKAIEQAAAEGKRWVYIEDVVDKSGKPKRQRRYGGETRKYWNLGINGSGSVNLYAMRPGYHAGSLPTMRQIGKGPNKDLRDDSFVWTVGEVPADIDYQAEANRNPDKDIPTHIPVDGYYLKATNADKAKSQADVMGWYVAGAYKINRIISDAEARSIIDKWNAEHPDAQALYDYERESGMDFDADQMKLVPKVDKQYSLKDSAGRELSKGQQAFFKDSKVRDENGNLLVMYQGGKGDFTVFDRKKSSYSNHYGRGFYFTNSENHAKQYGEARAFYLDIKNPVSTEETTITKAQLRKFLKAVAENEDDYSFENYGYGATVESVLQSIYGKSDFAMLYDVDQTAIGNMVETVELFNSINGTYYDGLILDTETVTFRSNQAKNVDNLNPTEDEDIRFSLKSPVEETKDLLALHNMTEKNLRGVLRLGGFPMPSLAIVKAAAGHTKYGPISVVFGKDTIDPQASSQNKVYGGDAYTPTDPGVYYPMDRDIERDFDRMVWEASQTFAGGEFKQSSPLGSLGYNGETRDDLDEIADRLARHEAVQAAYLTEQGKTLEPVMRETVSDVDSFGNDALQAYIDRIGETALIDKFYDHTEDNGTVTYPVELSESEAQIVREVLIEKWRNTPRFGKPVPDKLWEVRASKVDDWRAAKFAMNAWNFYVGGGYNAEEVDHSATKEAMQKMIAPSGAREDVEAVVRDWAKAKLDGLLGEPGVYNGKSAFTPSGNRRKFWARHDPYTLENIVKAMKANQQERGGQTFGISAGSLQATATPSYRSIAEIKADSGRLGAVSGEEYEASVQAVEEQINNVIETIKAGNKSIESYYYSDREVIGGILKEAAAGKKTVDAIVRKFKAEGYTISTQTAKDIQALYKAAAELPTEYFEAKPQRAVGFDEVLAVVVPNDLDSKLKEQMRQAGMNVLEFKAGDDADRLDVINTVDGAQFSLKGLNDLLAENAKLRQVHTALQEQFAVTTFEKADKKALDHFAKNLLKDWKSGADINETREALSELYTFVRETVKGDDPDFAQLEKRAYEVALPIIQSVVEVDDAEFQQYKELRNTIKRTGITLDKSLERDLGEYESLNEFRKAYFGKIRLVNNGLPVDSFYSELAGAYPGLFDEQEHSNPADQLLHIAQVLDELQPTEVNPYSHNMREATTWLATDIIQRIYDLPQAKPTFGDKLKGKVPKAVTGGLDEIGGLLEQQRTKLEQADAESRRAQGELAAAKATGNALITSNRQLKRELEQMKAENAKIIEESRKKVKDTITGQRMAAGREIEKLKRKQKEKMANASDTKKRQVMRAKILNHTTQLSKKLLRASDRNHIPQELQGVVAKLLESINLESNYSYDPQSDGYKKNDKGSPTLRTRMARELQKLYGQMANELTIDPDLLGDDGLLAEVIGMADLKLVDMTLSELETVWKAIRAIEASVKSADVAFNQSRWATISEAAEALRMDNFSKKDKVELDGPFGILGKSQKLTGIDMMTPEAYFHRLGKAGDGLFRMMRNAQDDHIRKMKEVSDFTHEALKGVNVRKLENKMHTVKLGGKEIQMSTAQIMELYVLMNREQAREHIMVGGILPDVVSKGGVKKVSRAKPVRGVQMSELLAAFRLLSEQEIQIAKKLQDYASTELSKWGNEAAMKVYNYEKFGEKAYWPIRVNRQETQSNVQKDTQVTSVAGRGFTKGTKPHANNSVMIGSIFDTFSTHASEMATYAAWLAPMEDINRIRNFTFKSAGETVDTVKGIIDTVHGKAGTAYLSKLLADLSNGVKGTHGETAYMSALVGNYKAASVGANLRVIIQQPTAILRALDMLGPQYLVAGVKPTNGWKKAKKYAPIAQWKDWGYFDINTGRQMKDVLFDSDSVLNKVKSASMWGAGAADSLSWGLLWNAVETETKHKRKDLKAGTEEFYQAVAERFNEVVDHTQVVDGILQRSQIMRQADMWTKMATSFLGEPTKQYNMMMSAAYDATHGGKDARRAAKKKFMRTSVALLIAGVTNAAAQAIMDAVRDDDKEKDYWEKWLAAFTGITGEEETLGEAAKNAILEGNLGNTLNPATYIPYVKDIVSLIQGYDVSRMDMESFEKTISASQNMLKALNGEGKYTIGGASANLFAEVARMAGIPVANLKREVKSFAMLSAVETDNYLLQYRMEKASLSLNYSSNSSTFLDILFNAYQNDKEAYDIIYADMIASGYDPEKLANGMETRMKKDEGVKKVGELEQRFLHPDQQSEWDKSTSNLGNSGLWYDATEEQRKDVEEKLYSLVTDSKSGQELQEKIRDGAAYGLDETEYLLYTLALDMYDTPNKSGELGGTPTSEEKANAIIALGGLNDGEIAYLWDTKQGYELYENGIDMKSYVDYVGAGGSVSTDKLLDVVDQGIAEETYYDFLDMLKEVDEPTKSGKLGSFTQKEATAAVAAMPGLTSAERAALWQSVNSSWKKNPWR